VLHGARSSCRTGRAAVGQLAVAASPFSRRARLSKNFQHSRAEARATLFRPIEKVPKETYVHSGNTFMREFPCITASVRRTQLDPVVLYHLSTNRHGVTRNYSGWVFGEFNVATVSACWPRCIAALASPTDIEVSPY